MKPRVSHQKTAALTLVEVFVIIVVLVVLAALLLPAFSNVRRQDSRWHQCIQNLKQIGLAYHVWAADHNGKFPMQFSVTNGGTMELTANGIYPWLNYLVMSNELSTPKLLVCPADKSRIATGDFTTRMSARNISYFVGLDASDTNPQMFLSGDDNFAISGVPVKSGLLEFSTNAPIAWTDERHFCIGNIVLADGSLMGTTQKGLLRGIAETGVATNRLAIP